MATIGFPGDPGEFQERKAEENYHRRVLEELHFLSEHFFGQYELNEPRLFFDVLLDWIGQFDGMVKSTGSAGEPSVLHSEARHAFILASKILFFNRNHILALLSEVWENIKKELVNISREQTKLSVTELAFQGNPVGDQLSKSLLVPLTDSSHVLEFRHHCIPEGTDPGMLMPCIDRLLLPLEMKADNFIRDFKERHAGRHNLFIIEDFSGSGSSAKWALQKIIDHYDFKNVYFCPLILTEMARTEIESLVEPARKKGVHFKIVCGITLGKEYSVAFDDSTRIWASEEKSAIREISETYFLSHFNRNAYLYFDYKSKQPNTPTPLGFRNTGLAIVLYSNCPNNSLPIIWADDGGWKPLFRRYERYVRRVGA